MYDVKEMTYFINTSRLILREIEETDTDILVQWRSDPKIYKFFIHAHELTPQEHIKWFRESYMYNENRIDWICYIKETGIPVGVFGIRRKSEQSSSIKISYLLDSSQYHKGYAKEAVNAILLWGSDNWKATIALAEIHVDNEVSIKFAKKLGFSQKGKKNNYLLYERMI